MTPPEVVAVLRFSSVGDVVLTAPALEALRAAWPNTRIVFAIKERLEHLVRYNPSVDEVLPIAAGEGPWSFSRRLKRSGIGAVLDLHGKIRSVALHALLPTVPWVAWKKREMRDTLPVKLALRPYRATMFHADRYHAAVEALVGRPLAKGRLQYHLGPQDRDSAARILSAAGVDPSRPILCLSPGANWQTKQWPPERFGEIAQRALDAGLQVVIQGTTGERPLAERIRSIAKSSVDLTGQLDLAALGGLISLCTAFVANDSGPMHMARALGVPTLAFFGSTDPKMFDFAGHAVLFAGVPCSPCSFFGRSTCPEGHFRCMLDLDVDRTWTALQPLLQGGRRALTGA
jgi:heptosyltransferase-2